MACRGIGEHSNSQTFGIQSSKVIDNTVACVCALVVLGLRRFCTGFL